MTQKHPAIVLEPSQICKDPPALDMARSAPDLRPSVTVRTRLAISALSFSRLFRMVARCFAVSKIHGFTVLYRRFERERPKVFCKHCTRKVNALGMRD